MGRPLSRRDFGFGLGAALLAAPFLSLLSPTRARGAGGGTSTRLIVFFSPNGSVLKHWRPSGSGANFAFPAGSILEPLASIKQHLTIVDGLDFVNANNHEGGMAAMLTGGGAGAGETGGKSIDQYVASKIGGATRFPSLELGVQTSAWGGSVQTRMCYAGPGQYVPPDDDPLSVYKRVFGDVVGGSSAEMDALVARRKSVIDVVKGDLSRLQSRVGSMEKTKLEAHLEAIRQAERGLTGGSCGGLAPPAATPIYDNARFPELGRTQMDLLVAALACGATNVASLQWAHTVAPQVFSWEGLAEGHHSLSHMDDTNASGVQQFVTAERWFATQFAYLVQRLAELPDPDGGGSLLDSTLVLWSKEMGDSRLHECVSVPFVLAGKAGGYLSPGRYVTAFGESHQKLLVSVSQAMGLTNQTFGDGSGGAGPLGGLA